VNNTEVMTFPDKDARNRVYEDLRRNGDDLERQVVKFSDCEPTGEKRVVLQGRGARVGFRLVYRSTYSVAYPRS
jgi:hypothetical protein